MTFVDYSWYDVVCDCSCSFFFEYQLEEAIYLYHYGAPAKTSDVPALESLPMIHMLWGHSSLKIL